MRILMLAAVLTIQMTTATVVAVTVDAAVVDGGGRPVTGLVAADFTVELDGHSSRVVAATYFPTGAPMAGAIGPAFDSVTPAAPVYRLVVQPPAGTRAGQDFAVAVAVRRSGAAVQAPPRVAAASVTVTGTPTAAAASVPKSTAERLRAAISTGRPERDLPIELGRAVRRHADPAKLTLEVHIEIAASAVAPLTGLLGLVDQRGGMRSATPQIEPAGAGRHRVDLSLPIDPGTYALRVAVADAAGTIGAIESPLNARLTAMGPLLASDLLRWTMDANVRKPFLLDAVPPDAVSLGATLELYPSASGAPPNDLLVKMELAGVERIVTPESRDGMLVADAEFPVQRVGSGSYTIRATVMSGMTALGTVSATVVKR